MDKPKKKRISFNLYEGLDESRASARVADATQDVEKEEVIPI